MIIGFVEIDVNSYINSYMDILEKAELAASIRHIARLLKSVIPIYISEVLDTAGRKTRKRRTKKKNLQSALRFTQRKKRF